MQTDSKGKILLIDPQEDRASQIRQLLLSWGYQARVCAGHLQALAWLEDQDFDLALVEIEASDIQGLEFCRLLRRREAQSASGFRTWLLVLGPEEYRERLSNSDAGADDFLLRPFLQAELEWRLRSGLNKQKLLGRLQRALRLELERPVLNSFGLYYTLQRELNRSSRKHKRLSLLLISLQGLELAELNFGASWAAWLESRILQTLEVRLRSYDKLAALARWQWCLLVPESAFADMQGLKDRLDQELQGVLQQEAQELGEIEVCFQGLNLEPSLQYWTINQGLDSLWTWIQEQMDRLGKPQGLQSGQITPDGILLED
jgi:DNA-binding response OmpR family regulator